MSIHIATVAANGSEPQRVTDDGDSQTGSFDGDPSFSPDGRRIAFSHGTFDSGTLADRRAAAEASARRCGCRRPAAPSNPAWSPDGVAGSPTSPRARPIMAVAATGGAPELVARDPPAQVLRLGRPGVVSRRHSSSPSRGDAGIYLVARRSAPASARLAIRVRCAEYPSFSPDGTQIAFDAPAGPPARRTDRDHGRERRRQRPAHAQHGAVPAERAPHLAADAVGRAWPNGTRCVCHLAVEEGRGGRLRRAGRHAVALHPWLTSAGEVSRGRHPRSESARRAGRFRRPGACSFRVRATSLAPQAGCEQRRRSVRDRARAVIIGGGITGCSVAYHLARAGWSDLVLLDKGPLTSGSTCHAAGLVTQFNPSPTMMRFRRYSIELYRELGVFETRRQRAHRVQPGVARRAAARRLAGARDRPRGRARVARGDAAPAAAGQPGVALRLGLHAAATATSTRTRRPTRWPARRASWAPRSARASA